jgi:hypothetical protein
MIACFEVAHGNGSGCDCESVRSILPMAYYLEVSFHMNFLDFRKYLKVKIENKSF